MAGIWRAVIWEVQKKNLTGRNNHTDPARKHHYIILLPHLEKKGMMGWKMKGIKGQRTAARTSPEAKLRDCRTSFATFRPFSPVVALYARLVLFAISRLLWNRRGIQPALASLMLQGAQRRQVIVMGTGTCCVPVISLLLVPTAVLPDEMFLLECCRFHFSSKKGGPAYTNAAVEPFDCRI